MRYDEDRYSRDEAGAADFERHRNPEPEERYEDYEDELSPEHREALLDPQVRAMIESCFEFPAWSENAAWDEPF